MACVNHIVIVTHVIHPFKANHMLIQILIIDHITENIGRFMCFDTSQIRIPPLNF